MDSKKILALIFILLLFAMCRKQDTETPNHNRVFSTSFESINDFNGFFIVPQNYMSSSSHEQSAEIVHSGTYSHKAWIYAANPESSLTVNNNHRAYPTIQFQKTDGGVFHTPCYISFWVWLDMRLQPHSPENQWFSFATLTTDSTDTWARTICVNLSCDGFVHLMHVPVQGSKIWEYQTTSLVFPLRTWVNIRIYLDTHPGSGYAKVWQDGTLVSYSKITDGNGTLAQAHFGLYASPSVSSGIVYNDDLEIREVNNE